MKKKMARFAGYFAAVSPAHNHPFRKIGGRLHVGFVRLLLALAIAGVAATGSGCIWFHDHDHWDHDHDDHHDDHHDDDMPH
jgi:hypothetical protein